MEEKLRTDVKAWNTKVLKMTYRFEIFLTAVIVTLLIIFPDLYAIWLTFYGGYSIFPVVLIVTAKKFLTLMDQPLSKESLTRYFHLTLFRQIPFILLDLVWLASVGFMIFFVFLLIFGDLDREG